MPRRRRPVRTVIPAAAQRLLAQRANAHVAMISKPGPITDIFLSAARGGS